MKKTVKLPPPLAALVVAGAIPGLPLEASRFVNRERFLVYATKQVMNQELPIEWVMEANNQMVYGNITSWDKLPSNAFVGYVELKPDPYIDTSIWGRGFNGQLYKVVMPRIFDNPIPAPSFMLDSARVKDFVASFPAHYLHELNEPWNWDYALEIPVSEALFGHVANVGSLTLDLCGDLKRIVLDENGNLRHFKELLLTCGNRHQAFPFKGEIVTVLNENQEPVLYRSISQDCGKEIREQLVLECGFPIR